MDETNGRFILVMKYTRERWSERSRLEADAILSLRVYLIQLLYVAQLLGERLPRLMLSVPQEGGEGRLFEVVRAHTNNVMVDLRPIPMCRCIRSLQSASYRAKVIDSVFRS
jgi:hypothetical protein